MKQEEKTKKKGAQRGNCAPWETYFNREDCENRASVPAGETGTCPIRFGQIRSKSDELIRTKKRTDSLPERVKKRLSTRSFFRSLTRLKTLCLKISFALRINRKTNFALKINTKRPFKSLQTPSKRERGGQKKKPRNPLELRGFLMVARAFNAC